MAPPKSTSCQPAGGNLVQKGTWLWDISSRHFFSAAMLQRLGPESLALSCDLEALRFHLEWPEGREDFWGGLWLHCGSLCPSLSRVHWSAPSPSEPSPPFHFAPSLPKGDWPPAGLLLHPVPVPPCSASSPYPSLTFSSFAPVPSTQVGCPPGKRNSLLSWLSGNTAWLEKFALPPIA